jgi:hypothetical protein
MGHDHDHDHAHDPNSYYLEQLLTIAVCGALSAVTILWWWNGSMKLFLVEKYHLLVVFGAVLLLALVVIRAVALWRSVDAAVTVPLDDHPDASCDHEHGHCDHDHAHEHEHAHHHHEHHEHSHDHGHDHDHDHDHSHGWAPWRFVVLLLPVVLYFLNLPNQTFSAGLGDRVGNIQLDLAKKVNSTGIAEIGFAQLQQASLTAESRDFYEGKSITLTGQYSGNDPKRFTLVRLKMACCAADAVPLNAVIMIDPNSSERIDPDQYRNKWVQVTGLVHFFNRPGSNEYITALILYPTKEKPLSQFIETIAPPANQYLN